MWSDEATAARSAGRESNPECTRRAALRDHQRLLQAIRDGNADRAVKLARDHLTAARRQTLALASDKPIDFARIAVVGQRPRRLRRRQKES